VLSLLDPLFRWASVDAAFTPAATLQALLDVEAALARAQAAAGLVPGPAAEAITRAARAERLDGSALATAAAAAGNLAIPLIAGLRALLARDAPEAAAFVHWGATSQDVIDTALVLQLRGALGVLDGEALRLSGLLAALARAHRDTPLAGRTWMQQAAPLTFGLEAAGWLGAVDRERARLAQAARACAVLQLGGAVGSRAALGPRGLEVARALAADLGLALPPLPWHAHRDRLAALMGALGSFTATLGKIARDVSLHAQTEVGELAEPTAPGRGGSSTMPHKRNPVGAAVALAAATRLPGLVSSFLTAMVQEQQRGLGGWPAEWEVVPEAVRLFAGALHHLTEALAGLHVDRDRMRANLEATHGLLFAESAQMALRARLGAEGALTRVGAAAARVRDEGIHLRAALAADPEVTAHVDAAALDRLFDIAPFVEAAAALVDEALAAHDAPPGETR